MKALPTIYLRRGASERVLAGHPWIYQGAVQHNTRRPTDGQAVQVRDAKRRFLGIGLYNSQSKIAVRLLSRKRESIDQSFFYRRLAAAQSLRKKLMPQASSYRLVHAEGDELSGLVIDKYKNICSLQISSLGIEQRLPQIKAALQSLCQPAKIIQRRDLASRKTEGLPTNPPKQETPTPSQDIQATHPIPIQMNKLHFQVDLLSGHKTGLYLDQQTNYQTVAKLLSQWNCKQILDCFTYQGGFALHAAAQAPESSILALDQSENAIRQANANAGANRLENRCNFQIANVFDWLKNAQTATKPDSDQNKFDAVILDPPSFTRNRSSIGDALRGYKEIHLRALRILKQRGLLITFCCSHHIDDLTFQETIAAAALDNRQCLRQITTFQQSPDHPVIPTIPETHYLKGFAYELLPR